MLRHDSAPSRAASRLLVVSALVTAAATWPGAGFGYQDRETFRADLVLLTIDVQVTPSKDAPVRELSAADFQVAISGRNRPVTSAAQLHLDEASVMSNPPRAGQASDTVCIFGFHRRIDRPTAHYVLGVQPTDSDRGAKPEVKVKTVDPAFATEWLVWRMPIR